MREQLRQALHAPVLISYEVARLRAEYHWYVASDISAQLLVDLTPATMRATGWPSWRLTLLRWYGFIPETLAPHRVNELRTVRDEIMEGSGIGPWQEDRRECALVFHRWLSLSDLNEVSALIIDGMMGRLQKMRELMTPEQDALFASQDLPGGCQVHLSSLLFRSPSL